MSMYIKLREGCLNHLLCSTGLMMKNAYVDHCINHYADGYISIAYCVITHRDVASLVAIQHDIKVLENLNMLMKISIIAQA